MLERFAVLLAVVAILFGSTCPVTMGEPVESTEIGAEVLDVGGVQGASWKVSADRTLTVRLHADGEEASATVEAESGYVTLLGRTIAIADFCWRTDTICPHQVLLDATITKQPFGDGRTLVSFNRRGPLAELFDREALEGHLVGNDLAVPLAVGGAGQGTCGLLASSGVLATARATMAGEGTMADSLEGRVTVAFTGLCFSLGGQGDLLPGDTLMISAAFVADRL
ncbi:MAG: hypothetical protein JRH20_00230 [Deltaproteobacteria bacterium]|nr:hypothetical protein [Deltaproteobacteria bacterium]